MTAPRPALAHFAALVRSFREEAGFDNARAFYQAQGGAAFWGCTYKAYLNLEKGAGVPQPKLVERLATALRVALSESKAREFSLAYLRILIGFDEFLEFAVQTLADKGPDPGAPAMERSYEERAVRLTPAQSELLTSTDEVYWSFTLLANDRERRSAAELAQAMDLDAEKVSAALQALAKSGLAARDKDGRWRCPHAGKVFLHPKEDPYVPKALDTLEKRWDSPGREKVLLEHPLLLRASESDLRNYFPYLVQSVQSADLYSTCEKGSDTAFFALEAQVLKVLPF